MNWLDLVIGSTWIFLLSCVAFNDGYPPWEGSELRPTNRIETHQEWQQPKRKQDKRDMIPLIRYE